MAYIADCTKFAFAPLPETRTLIAVGWLHPDYDYVRGSVPCEFVTTLFGLLKDRWGPAASGGSHHCEFCVYSGGPRYFHLAGTNESVRVGGSELFVPDNGWIYVAPSLIIHYIDAHQFYPPIEFQDAVLRCPEMRSMAYLRELLANGLSSTTYSATRSRRHQLSPRGRTLIRAGW